MSSPSDLLVIFNVSGCTLALPADAVAEIVPEPALSVPPAMPPVLAGLFRLRGRVVPVVRPDRLLDLPAPAPGPFRALLVLHSAHGPWALLVERVAAVVRCGDVAAAPSGLSLNDCVGAVCPMPEGAVPVLAPSRLMCEREAQALAGFAARAAERLEDFGLDHV